MVEYLDKATEQLPAEFQERLERIDLQWKQLPVLFAQAVAEGRATEVRRQPKGGVGRL